MSDLEEDIMNYTPLKRKKIRLSDSISSSQVSSSKVVHKKNNFKYQVASSQSVRNKKKTIPHFYHSQYSIPRQFTNQSPFKVPFKLKSASLTNVNKTNELQNKSYEVPPPNLKSVCDNYKQKLLVEPSTNKPNGCDNASNRVGHITNIFDEDTPDIDFTELECITPSENAEEVQSYSNYGENDSTILFPSPVKEIPCLDNVNKAKSKVFSKDFSCELEQALKPTPEKLDAILGKELSFHNDDDDFIEPTLTKVEKVNAWLTSTQKHLASLNVKNKLKPHTSAKSIKGCTSSQVNEDEVIDIATEQPSLRTSIESLIDSKPDQNKDEGKPKTCIHLHFHVHSPEKFVQPTIEHFFGQPSSPSQPSDDSKSKCQKTGSNNKDVINAWKTIMDSMKEKNKNASEKSKRQQKMNRHWGLSGSSTETNNTVSATTTFPHNCPFYKCVEDTNFVVDAFQYGYINGVSIYFLSHFHSDHYRGLTKKFCKAIYCSQVTANLVRLKIGVQSEYLCPIPLEEPRIIDGVEVTLYDANHCPGSVMFLFRLLSGKTILHVGDFRAHYNMEAISALQANSLDVLYLDTTYLDPMYDFPSQEDTLDKCVQIVRRHKDSEAQTLFVVGSYIIGKEKVFKAVAEELDCKVFATSAKQNILRCLGDQSIIERLTNKKFEAQVHVLPMMWLSLPKLKKYLDDMRKTFNSVVALRPTGWEHSCAISDLEDINTQQLDNVYIYGIPYSEHSSYGELQRFVKFTQPEKIIPTVNNESIFKRHRMEAIFTKWLPKKIFPPASRGRKDLLNVTCPPDQIE